VAGLGVLALVVLASSAQLHGWLVAFLPSVESLIRAQPLLGATVFVVFAALSAMLAFVSSAVIVPVGIFVWGKGVSMGLLLLGWVLGGVCAYALSRSLGRAAARTLVPAATLERYESRVSRQAPFGLVLLFQLAVPSEIPGYLLGLARYDFRKYLAAVTLAELPYAVATVYLGESFLERRFLVMILVGAAITAFSGWTLALLHRRLRAPRG
jgi:uncharacterized membrane protein YdjX (TVP38/TMEM64 family)